MGDFQGSLLEFLALLTVLIERTGAARNRPGVGGRGSCRSRVRTAAPERLLLLKDAVEPGGSAPATPQRGKEERSLITILDTVQGDLLSCPLTIPSCEH